MSSEIWEIDRKICRCCHSGGANHNMAEPISYLGEMEVYSDMLRECFGIDIIPVPGELCAITYSICKLCIMKLRQAFVFKKEVQSCEKRFMDLYRKNSIRIKNCAPKPVSIKEEPETLSIEFKEEYLQIEAEDEDIQYPMDFNDDDSEDDVEIARFVKDKGKGKGKTEKGVTVKVEKKREKKPLVKVEVEGEAPAAAEEKQKKGKKTAPKFRLKAEDYEKLGDTYRCKRCDKTYNKMFSLRFHVKTKHYRVPRYICQLCTKEFMTLAPFTVHKLEAHNIDDRFKCKACTGTFNTKLQLKKHTNNFHMLGTKYKCELCDYESFSFESIYKHKFKHKTVKDYHCTFCRKSFLRKTTLDLHVRIHTGDRRSVCKICSQAFVQKASLNYHMAKIHPEVNF